MDDLISRQAAIDEIRMCDYGLESWQKWKLTTMLKDIPPAQPERKKGRWIDNNGLYQCPVCKHIWSELWWVSMCPIDRMNEIMRYCPYCGADMRGDDDETD